MKYFTNVIIPCFAIGLSTLLTQPVQAQTTAEADGSTQIVEPLLQFAGRHLHLPYRYGGTSGKGFDCSGFVRYIFSEWGLSLPHSSKALAGMGKKVDVSEARPGDLIFFRGSGTQRGGVSHVGIVTEVTPRNLRFIHSAVTSGIRYDFLQSEYYMKRFVAIRRILTDE